jgi:outer membrane autotransporter protein
MLNKSLMLFTLTSSLATGIAYGSGRQVYNVEPYPNLPNMVIDYNGSLMPIEENYGAFYKQPSLRALDGNLRRLYPIESNQLTDNIPKSVILGDPSNPVIKISSTGIDNRGVKIDIAGKGTVYDSSINEGRFDVITFLASLNKEGSDDFVGLYDSNGSRGVIIGGKYYPSIFAAFNDITISGFPNNDEFNRLIRSLGRKVPDIHKQAEHEEIQKDLQHLVSLVKESERDAVEDSNRHAESIAVLQAKINDLAKQITEKSKFSSLPPVLAPDNASTEVILFSAGDAVTELIESRMDNSDAGNGVAAGDTLESFGVWVRGTLGRAKQKEMNLVPEYKLNQQGVTIGADIGEDDLIGVAFTVIASKLKQNSMRENANNYIGSIYGLYNFTDNIFINAQLKYGRYDIKKERSVVGNNNAIKGKTKADMAGGKAELGYYYGFMDKAQLIPSIALSYDTVTVKKYTESGANLLTRTVGKRTCNRSSFIGGLLINYAIDFGSFVLTPEVHSNVNYVLKRKESNTSITLIDGTSPVYIPSGKSPKASYKIGASLTASKSKHLEFAIGYDLGLSKKFYSHSGYVQARVDF